MRADPESVEDSASDNNTGDAVTPTPLTTVPAVNPNADQNSEQQQDD